MRHFTMVSAAAFAGGLAALWMTPEAPPPQPPLVDVTVDAPPPARSSRGPLESRLANAGLARGDGVFIRIFKEERQLEVWLRDGEGFRLFDTYPICYFSGAPGPKLKEGDRQSPEGFYEVGRAQLNPHSSYHLSFNLGFPNAFDRAHGRTGSHLMVHGDCVSIGCYAMTDPGIDDIYALVAAALTGGQRSVPVHIFPFRMTDEALNARAAEPWADFWANLKEGYDAFAASGRPPSVSVCDGRYVFGAAADGCRKIEAW